jgi:RNA polymerase sigma factor (sigma-70 family)
MHPCVVRIGGNRYEPEGATLEVAGHAFEAGARMVSLPFEDFYEAQHRSLFGAMCLIAGNRHDAEEITQEAFITVWERWDRVERMENPAGYLYRTAMNTFRMRFRRAKIAARRVARSIAKSEDLDVFEARHELDRGLAMLSPRQRVAIVLTELIELSSAEAGKAMGVKPATVRKLASQGREALRGAIGDVDG